jgi:hypothetical protein
LVFSSSASFLSNSHCNFVSLLSIILFPDTLSTWGYWIPSDSMSGQNI